MVQGAAVEGQRCAQSVPQVLLRVQLHVVGLDVGLLGQAPGRQHPGLLLTRLPALQAHELGHLLHTLPRLHLLAQLVVDVAQVGPGVEVTRVFLTDVSVKGYALEYQRV